jgi:hypothetical protein
MLDPDRSRVETPTREIYGLPHFSSVGNCWIMDNLRPGGALRWKVKTIGWEGREVVCEKPSPSGP